MIFLGIHFELVLRIERLTWLFIDVKELGEQKKRERTYYAITERDNVFLSIICIIEVFEMMATLAIDGLDSNEIAGCKTKEREEGGDWREEKKTKGKKWREVLIKNEEEEEIERESGERKRKWEGKEKVRSDHLESVLNHTSPAKVRFYEGNCTSTLCLYTGVDW